MRSLKSSRLERGIAISQSFRKWFRVDEVSLLTLDLTPWFILRLMNGFLQIGAVAAQTGLTADAIRFYEREKLLRVSARSSGGFRLFSGSDVKDLNFIRNAQELGFSLEEIRELLSLKQALHSDCKQVERLLERKIEIVRGKLASLRKLERELLRAVWHCQSNLRGASNSAVKDCPVLADISQAKRGARK